jgi:thiamine-phosphate pyrophosphorylase
MSGCLRNPGENGPDGVIRSMESCSHGELCNEHSDPGTRGYIDLGQHWICEGVLSPIPCKPPSIFPAPMNNLPRLYAILDSSCFRGTGELLKAAEELAAAGVMLIQYRDKSDDPVGMLSRARELKQAIAGTKMSEPHGIKLIMNDRADLCLAAEFDGVHVGQDDLSPESARSIIGPERWLGASTHNHQQVTEADKTPADYIAIGPVFKTQSKASPNPVIGLEGIREARALTRRPLVAIGGITRANCRSVIDAGADSVAVISDLVRHPCKSAEEFLCILG